MFLSSLLVQVRKLKTELNEVLEIQRQLEKGFERMSTKADELKAKLADIGNDLVTIGSNATEVDGDLQEVLDKLNALSDSPTPQEMNDIINSANDLKAKTAALAADTRATADKVPEPPTS